MALVEEVERLIMAPVLLVMIGKWGNEAMMRGLSAHCGRWWRGFVWKAEVVHLDTFPRFLANEMYVKQITSKL